MIFGYNHQCSYGHTYQKFVFFGDKPKCPSCAVVERFTERTRPNPADIRLAQERYYRDRYKYRPAPAKYSYSRTEPSIGVASIDPSPSVFFEAPLGRSYEKKRDTFASGGGGDFGGGGATGSWEPATESCSRSSDSSSSYSSDSSSSCSSDTSSSSSSSD